MNPVEFIRKEFGNYYIDNGAEHGILEGTKYAGYNTHCANCLYTLTKMLKAKYVLEIGSYKLWTTTRIAEAMDEFESSKEGFINTFDLRSGGTCTDYTAPTSKRIKQHFWYPQHSDSDTWKYLEPIAYPEFKTLTDEEIFEKNREILQSVAPPNQAKYDIIFIDGDHSTKGISYDWKHALEWSDDHTLIVIDNVWDIRLSEVRNFFDNLNTVKWDFEEWNDANTHRNCVMDTGITLRY